MVIVTGGRKQTSLVICLAFRPISNLVSITKITALNTGAGSEGLFENLLKAVDPLLQKESMQKNI